MSMESPLTKTLVKSLAERLHAKHFSEEYDDRFDSVSEAKVRRRRINPMSQGYIDKMDSKRRQLGVSKLGLGGKPQDNKSRELAGQWAMDLVAAHESALISDCLLYTSPSPRDRTRSRMPSSA